MFAEMVDSSAGEISNWLTPRRPLSAIAIPLKKANPPPKKGINSANEAGEAAHKSFAAYVCGGKAFALCRSKMGSSPLLSGVSWDTPCGHHIKGYTFFSEWRRVSGSLLRS